MSALRWSRDEAIPMGQGCYRLRRSLKHGNTRVLFGDYQNPNGLEYILYVMLTFVVMRLTLSSLSFSRVFLDLDVQPTRDYLTWLDSNTDVANRVNPDIVTKAETVTIGDLFSYIKHEGSKLSVYDKNDHGFFVLLGDAGRELTGKPASKLVERYFEANESVGDDHMVPVPQALIDTIGQTRTFIVKVSKHNLDGKTRSLTVTKVLPLEAAAADGNLEENVIVSAVEETLQMGKRVDGSSSEHEGSTDAAVKRSFDGDESQEAKRAKCG
ncbi:hypothetical protein Bca52824_049296 [Brassica carinata]|uniref:Uncharacterized protein n=1 Tax=Brassica carinata TaxID=52824 RepID=A0A8X7RKM5_BRACI|nr:hypothetical protein Bca52824_049296 [Brassica carinata]